MLIIFLVLCFVAIVIGGGFAVRTILVRDAATKKAIKEGNEILLSGKITDNRRFQEILKLLSDSQNKINITERTDLYRRLRDLELTSKH